MLALFSLRKKDWEIGTRTWFWRDLGGGTSQKCEKHTGNIHFATSKLYRSFGNNLHKPNHCKGTVVVEPIPGCVL